MSNTFGIDWSDFASGYAQDDRGYAAGVGNGTSEEDLRALNKALSAGDGQAVPGQANAGELKPLMPESLDGTLNSLTYTEEEFPFWKALYKDRAYNTAEEFNQLEKVGQGEAGFIAEGDLPEEEDSTYRRRVTLIKFMGVTRRVTHVASIVRTAGIDSAITAETRDGTTWLMRILEESLFYGDSALVPLQFDGFKKLMIDGGSPVYDARGAYLTMKIVNALTAVVRKRPNYGRVSHLFLSIGAKSDVVNDFFTLQRTKSGEKLEGGQTLDKINTQNGSVELVDDIFIEERQGPFANGLGKSTKRPLIPVLNGAVASPNDAGGGNKWKAGDAGTYIWGIVAGNRYGRSAPVYTAGHAVAADDRVEIPIADGGQGTTYYIVYRSEKDGAQDTCKEAFRIARTGGTQTITDRNLDLPGCSDVFGFEMKPGTMLWKQLAPFTKIPLATQDTSIRWMQVLYGAPQLRKPRHCFLIKNLGRDPNSPVVNATVGLDGF